MTRKIFIVSTLFFWLAVGTLATTTFLWVSADSAMADAPLKTISPAELAKHAKPDDCWLAIGGGVYNLSDDIVKLVTEKWASYGLPGSGKKIWKE